MLCKALLSCHKIAIYSSEDLYIVNAAFLWTKSWLSLFWKLSMSRAAELFQILRRLSEAHALKIDRVPGSQLAPKVANVWGH